MELVMVLMVALMAAILVVLVDLRKRVELLSVNPNFGVLTRQAALMESANGRRRGGSDHVVVFDVAGMGRMNSLHGEEWVNKAIKAALDEIRAGLRAGDVIGQLNSGDEFFVSIKSSNPIKVRGKIMDAFLTHWSEGIYLWSVEVEAGESVIEAARRGMEHVYETKRQMKAVLGEVK